MSILTILLYILFGFLIGVLAKIIMRYHRSGFIFTTILGFVGSILGHLLFVKLLKLNYRLGIGSWAYVHIHRGHYFNWLWALVGALLIIFIGDRFFGHRRFRR